MVKKSIFISFAIMLFFGYALAQEKQQEVTNKNHMIFTRAGDEYVGELKSIDSKKVVFIKSDGNVLEFELSEIVRIKIPKKRKFQDITKLKDLDDQTLKDLIANAPSADKVPGYIAMNLLTKKTYELLPDGNWIYKKRAVSKILTEEGKQIATQAFQYLSKQQSMEIVYARSISPDGNIYNVSDEAVLDEPLHGDSAEYNNLRHTKFALKNVNANYVIDYEIEYKTKDGEYWPMYIDDIIYPDEPSISRIIEVIVPKGNKLKYLCENRFLPKEQIKIEEKQLDDGRNVVTCVVGLTRGFKNVEYSLPPDEEIKPRFIAATEKTWEQVSKEYVKHAPRSINLDGKRGKIDDLVKIFEKINRGLRKIDVGMTSYGYLPKEGLDAKDLGNTLDRTVMFIDQCRKKGIKAGLVFVRPSNGGALQESIPNIRQFFSCLAKVQSTDGYKYIYLGNRDMRFAQLPSSFQGTMALDLLNNKLVKIPFLPIYEDSSTTEISVQLYENGKAKISTEKLIKGARELGYRELIEKTKQDVDTRIVAMIGSIDSRAKNIKWSLSNYKDFTKPITFKYEYEVDNFIRKGGEKLLLFKLPEISYSAFTVAKPERMFPYYIGGISVSDNKITFKLPKGYEVRFVSPSYEIKSNSFESSASFSDNEDEIVFKNKMVYLDHMIMPQEYPKYKESVENMVKVTGEWIIIEKKD